MSAGRSGRHGMLARFAVGFGVAAALAACASTDGPARVEDSTEVGTLAQAFESSAAKAGVPRDLLVAIAKVEDGLRLPAVRLSLDKDNEVPAAGPLQLRRGKFDTLARAATLAHTTELDLRIHADLALHAGAMVLAELGQQTGATASDLTTWKGAIEEMGGFADDAHREKYAHEVFATLARGGRFTDRDGAIIDLPAHDLPPTLTLDIDTNVHTLALPEFPGAEVFPTSCNNKCNTDRGAKVQYVAIHDTEGSWNSAVATLQNDPGKSVHYIIDTDGKVGQFVGESVLAWHIGNLYYNARSVGIEHVGYYQQPYPEAEYVASAKLVNYLIKKYDIPADRAHIIGHNQAPDGSNVSQSAPPCMLRWTDCTGSYGGSSHHTDPGVWEWATYMPRIGGTAKCNDVWDLWNCSSDKTRAFRCVNDKVEVMECASACEVQANGVDDKCTPGQATDAGADAASSDDASSTGDANAPTPTGDAATPPSTNGADAATPPASGPPGTKVTAPPESDDGCSVTRGVGRSRGPEEPLALGSLLCALALIRRAKVKRPRARTHTGH